MAETKTVLAIGCPARQTAAQILDALAKGVLVVVDDQGAVVADGADGLVRWLLQTHCELGLFMDLLVSGVLPAEQGAAIKSAQQSFAAAATQAAADEAARQAVSDYLRRRPELAEKVF